MINLLPPELKQEYRYARRNRRLIHWAAAFAVAIVGLGVITGTGMVIMSHSASTYKAQIVTTEAELASQNITGVQKQVTEISNNLKLMVTVLSKEILFSKLLARLGSITPSNTILTDLSISQTESAIDITARTSDYNAATQLQANLADPNNQIFAKADIVTISCTAQAGDALAAYPCTATIRALFTDNNPFLFINSAKAGS